uniref:XPG N-terminal domain-containing protein n=1 Tax=Noctiluca scintillans TaxID=2966 RepID=A0A7S1AHB7_NOCSC|mmetsp:Transcript_46284/g.122846  ORF Transcript_46284/g.122846 Transcript_46284/m.122846 type:complete len:751 (+) Transcript_46284:70-2322(+)|eukprot:CAMPEP_0194497288 /NCGR_PEP_ID=MMETSP0253-20130528/14272_1 /TAXON_ID=2966 /ORGANISM="Noctiluca scintillans" /LENGTH=750 /DNA_ID=CAMNT_0039338775 /DNA_START=73 /DNA_END=2325 /DNA_ORIENTATION=+
MRVRHLQSHLSDQQLVHQGKLDSLRSIRVGVDAVFWLRSIQALKDPFADALGGIPPGIFGFVDKELEAFRKQGITPLFVFQGVAPGPQHSMFVSRMDQQMELAWTYLAKGQKSEAQKCFAVSTSRINGDFVYFIFHHLRNKGYECLQAPYFAGAQLAHFAEQGVVQTVFGPPGLLLYGVQRVVIHIDFQKGVFDWVDLTSVLEKWQITRDMFVDACMLAGTEYCLTYPYLNLGHFQPVSPGRFNFDAAVYIIKQAPLINWMQTFPTEEMKNDHVDGYCICKVLVQNSPVMNMQHNVIRPLNNSTVPYDFQAIMGEKLPNSLYYLMLNGVISHKLPQALSKGEWTDKSQPLVDTQEFRGLLEDLQCYRQLALGLVARHLHERFQRKRILCKAFWEPHLPRSTAGQHPGAEDQNPKPRELIPDTTRGLPWRIEKTAVDKEMVRQGVDKVDFKFCLQWHAHEFDTDGALIQDLQGSGEPSFSNDANALAALVHFMVLERLELIDRDDGGMTVLSAVLMETPRNLQEPCLVALEMLKFGVLTNEPFDAAQPDRPFPQQVQYPTPPVPERVKAVLLLCRVMSLVPMRLRNDMWNADVDFDLAAFHSLIRVLKRALRQLVEASLTSILLKDLKRVKLLPPGFMCASPKKDDHMQTPAMLPTFMLPRACMGIVVRFFLDYTGDPASFQSELQSKFPCCMQAKEDLKNAFLFWEDLRRCIKEIAEPLGAQKFLEDMDEATELLVKQQTKLGIKAVSRT